MRNTEPPWGAVTLTDDQLEQLEDLARDVRAASDLGEWGVLERAALALAEAVFPAEIQAERDEEGS